MSYIFEALQRCESERSGTDPATLANAVRLLDVVERGAAPERGNATRPVRQETSTGAPNARPPVVNRPQPLLVAEHSANLRASTAEPGPLRELEKFRAIPALVQAESRLVSLTEPESLAAEKFRYLAVRLQEARKGLTLRTVLVTSTIPQEGKSTLACNLACTLGATTREKVLLVDGDLRRSSIRKLFGLPNIPGLADCLQGKRALESCVYELQGPKVWVLAAGEHSTNPLELLQANALPELMEELKRLFDWIVIDSAPVLPMADTSIWMRLSDVILLATRPGVTKSAQLQRGLEAIDVKKLIGAVSNGSQRPAHGEYYYSTSGDQV